MKNNIVKIKIYYTIYVLVIVEGANKSNLQYNLDSHIYFYWLICGIFN